MASIDPFNFDIGQTTFNARPIEASDKKKYLEAFNKLSVQSTYLRFFSPQKNLTEKQLKYFTEVDGVNHIAWIIIDTTEKDTKGIAVGRIIRMKNEPTTAEVAITVIDEYQQMGIGTILLAILNIVAAKNDIKIFRYYVLHSNKFITDILGDLGILKKSYDGEIVKIDSKVRSSHRDFPDLPSLKGYMQAMKRVETLIA